MLPPDLVPLVDETSEPWWNATRQRRLVVQLCEKCGAFQHYPRALCSHCGAGPKSLSFVDSAGVGTLLSYTVVHRSPHPQLDVPYTVALVALDEGPIMLSLLEGCDEPVCALRVSLDWRPVGDGRHLPVFRPFERGDHP